jgi:transcription antitermination factor NusG
MPILSNIPALSCEKELWFAVQVTPRHEKKVASLLEYKNYRQFLPTAPVRRRWSDRVKVLDEPLFPCYVFCRSRSSRLGGLRGTPGIIRVVSFGGKPCPLADYEIENLLRVIESKRDVSACPYLATGQTVHVISGPLTGVRGIITQIKKRNRLVLSVDMIMKSLSIEIDESEIAPFACTASA